VAVTRTV